MRTNLKYVFAIALGMILVQTLRHWDRLPFNIYARQIQAITIEAISDANVMTLKINNRNYYDIQDPEIRCNFLGQSGTPIKSEEFKVFQTINSNSVSFASESIEIPFQTATINCHVVDSQILETVNGKKNEPITLSSIKKSS